MLYEIKTVIHKNKNGKNKKSRLALEIDIE